MLDTIADHWRSLRGSLKGFVPKPRPPRRMPAQLAADFTLHGKIPVLRRYLDGIRSNPLRWTSPSDWWDVELVKRRATRYYGQTDTFLYQALDKYPVDHRDVVVVGTEVPWYECVLTCFGARVTTIEYRRIHCQIPDLTVLTPAEYAQSPVRFDMAVSISSIEHDGLGRYGDPINPNGDLRAMREFKEMLKPGGLLLLAVPVGQDAVVWNAHRIFGRKRLPLLMDGWELIDSFGFSEKLFDAKLGEDVQPVFVLRSKDS